MHTHLVLAVIPAGSRRSLSCASGRMCSFANVRMSSLITGLTSVVEELDALRDQFNVKRMYVSHMSEAARLALLAAETRLNVTVADDGMQVDVS